MAVLAAAPVVAQTAERQSSPQLGIRPGLLFPLYHAGETGTSNPLAGTVHAGLALGRGGNSEIEAFVTLGAGGRGERDSAPRVRLAGVLFHAHRGLAAAVTPVVTVGVGLVELRAHGSDPPRTRLPTAVGGAGIELAVRGPIRLRLDVRGHMPIGGEPHGDGGRVRYEVGAGLRYAR